MKKLFVVVILFCSILTVHAEEFKAFRVDLGLGYAISEDGEGVILSFEPKYAVIPQLALGFRIEAAAMVQGVYNYTSEGVFLKDDNASAKLNGSYLLTGDYYFTNKKFRPFGGLGLGIYSLYGAEINGATEELGAVEGKNNFGFMLRAGFDVSHFRLSIEYNIAGKVKYEVSNADLSTSFNYLGIKANVYFGGGVKK